MSKYEIDRSRSDSVISDVQRIVEMACGWDTELANEFLDQSQATDLIVSKRNLHIAVRSRSYKKYFDKYRNEFTIRSRRTNGAETELSKIRNGFGDYIFYGFADGWHHRCWKILDLTVLRGSIEMIGIDAFSVEKSNNDGTYFRAFDVRLFGALKLPIIFKEGNDNSA